MNIAHTVRPTWLAQADAIIPSNFRELQNDPVWNTGLRLDL